MVGTFISTQQIWSNTLESPFLAGLIPILPFLEAIGQHRDKLQSIRLHLDFKHAGRDVYDDGIRGYESMRRRFRLLSGSKALRLLSMDLDWATYPDIRNSKMANGLDQLRTHVVAHAVGSISSRVFRDVGLVYDNCKAGQGKANVRRKCVFPIRFLRAWSFFPYPCYGPNGPSNQHFGHRSNSKTDV